MEFDESTENEEIGRRRQVRASTFWVGLGVGVDEKAFELGDHEQDSCERL